MKKGDQVKFRDSNATGYKVCTGVVNGDPMKLGHKTLIPIWTERKGREATTVYVDQRNIVGQETYAR